MQVTLLRGTTPTFLAAGKKGVKNHQLNKLSINQHTLNFE